MTSGPALLCGEILLEVSLISSRNKSVQRERRRRRDSFTAQEILNMLGENLGTERGASPFPEAVRAKSL